MTKLLSLLTLLPSGTTFLDEARQQGRAERTAYRGGSSRKVVPLGSDGHGENVAEIREMFFADPSYRN